MAGGMPPGPRTRTFPAALPPTGRQSLRVSWGLGTGSQSPRPCPPLLLPARVLDGSVGPALSLEVTTFFKSHSCSDQEPPPGSPLCPPRPQREGGWRSPAVCRNCGPDQSQTRAGPRACGQCLQRKPRPEVALPRPHPPPAAPHKTGNWSRGPSAFIVTDSSRHRASQSSRRRTVAEPPHPRGSRAARCLLPLSPREGGTRRPRNCAPCSLTPGVSSQCPTDRGGLPGSACRLPGAGLGPAFLSAMTLWAAALTGPWFPSL